MCRLSAVAARDLVRRARSPIRSREARRSWPRSPCSFDRLAKDFSFSPEELSFRDEVRAFIRDNLPASIRAKTGKAPHYGRADVLVWHKILDARGWAASH
jgi:hypothetical protein